MTSNEKYTPFSNGSEYMTWQCLNCERCVRAVWYNERTGKFPKYRCRVQEEIDMAAVTDGYVSERTYNAVRQSQRCPYIRTERKHYAPKKKKYGDELPFIEIEL